LQVCYKVSKRKACSVLEFQRSSCYYSSVATERLGREHSLPRTIRVDNGPEFISKRLDQWAYLNGVELDFSRPGKPTDNGLIEAFNGRLRQECLNENWFLSLDDAREKVEEWRLHYNRERPHGALGNLSPVQFAVVGKVIT